MTFLSGKRYSLDTLRSLGAGELLNSMCEFSEKLAALRLDSDEMSLFTAVVLVSAGKKASVVTRLKYYAFLVKMESLNFLLPLPVFRSLRDPGPKLSRGPAGQTDPSTAKPGDAEPRRRVRHHLHQAAAQASRAAFTQQHALRGTALLQSSPLKSFLKRGTPVPLHLIHTSPPPPGPASLLSPPSFSVFDQPSCVFVSRMY